MRACMHTYIHSTYIHTHYINYTYYIHNIYQHEPETLSFPFLDDTMIPLNEHHLKPKVLKPIRDEDPGSILKASLLSPFRV